LQVLVQLDLILEVLDRFTNKIELDGEAERCTLDILRRYPWNVAAGDHPNIKAVPAATGR